MSKYEVNTSKLADVGSELLALSNSLDALMMRLNDLSMGRASGLNEFRRRKQVSAENLREASLSAKNFGNTLSEIATVYYDAERSAFGDEQHAVTPGTGRIGISPIPAIPTLRQSNSVVFSGNLIVPNWLQSAVIKYEQARRKEGA